MKKRYSGTLYLITLFSIVCYLFAWIRIKDLT